MDTNALVSRVASRSGLPREDVDRALDALRETVVRALNDNEDVVVEGLGVWNRPTRNHGTPAFHFLTDLSPSPDCPVAYRQDDETNLRVRQIGEYLRANHAFNGPLGLDLDPFPDLDPASHPGVVTSQSVDEWAGADSSVRPEAIAARVIENMRLARA